MKPNLSPLLAEIERGLELRLGTLSLDQIEALLAPAHSVMHADDDVALVALRQFGLDVLRLVNERLRHELTLHDPLRRPPVEGSRVH